MLGMALGLVVVALSQPARADGGNGGGTGAGTGGVDAATGPGGTGGDGPSGGTGGGGGGGAGATGGNGGLGGDGEFGGGGGAGGAGGASPGASGGNGAAGPDFSGEGGGGGGGGAHGAVVATTASNSTALSGGLGGAGGLGGENIFGEVGGGGGGGGGGGYGVVVINGATFTNATSATMSGGNGGNGGNGGTTHAFAGPGGGGGVGGSGGIGALFTNGGSLSNVGSITGGNGGSGGNGGFSQSIAGPGGGGGVGGSGGIGALFTNGGSLSNFGSITGGHGGNGGDAGDGLGILAPGTAASAGGSGGMGAQFTNGGTFSNSGTISGGNGGNGGGGGDALDLQTLGGAGGNGGDGGIGVQFTNGGTLINSGTISGGNGGTGGSGGIGSATGPSGSVGSGAAAIVGSNLTVINSGTISGGFDGSNSVRAAPIIFTGGTNALELRAGSTIIGNVVAFSAADTFRLGGAIDSSFNASLIGSQYQGFGNFQKTGDSTWTLAGSNSTAMPWAINGGVLNVTGNLPNAAMTVNGGATLTGVGTVGTTQVNSGGTFAPGSGTPGSSMTVSGNLTFQPGSSFVAIASAQTASFANVTGTATLAGTVQAAFVPGSYIQKTYTLLRSSARNGTFSSLGTLNLPAGFTANLDYTGTDALLNLVAQFNGGTSLGGLGACGAANQCATGNAVTNFFNNGGSLSPTFQAIYGQTGSNLTQALSLLSGEPVTGAQRAVFELGDQFLTLILDPFTHGVRFGAAGGGRLSLANDRQAELRSEIAQTHGEIFQSPGASAPAEQRWSAWGAGFGGSNLTLGDANGSGSHDVTANTYGFATGMDYRGAPGTVAGFAVAVGGTSWYLGNGLGGGRSTAFQAGLYGSTHFGPAYLAGAIQFSNHWVETDRYSFLSDHLSANFNVINFGGRVEGGYRFEPTPGVGVIPYGAIQVQAFRMPGYSETDTSGVGFGLNYAATDATATRSELGARFDHLTEIAGTTVMLRGRLAWAHDWISNPAVTATFQGLPGASFVVNGATPPTDSALTSVGAEVWFKPSLSVLAKFDGEFAGTAQTYSGTARLRYRF